MRQPLANRIRPNKLSDIKGQIHLIGPNKIISNIILKQNLVSIIFYGPPGTGKTTLAKVMANELQMQSRQLNAATCNKKDLEKIFEETKFYDQLILILDEVHRLNKDKQDLLLPYLEEGKIILIGATTANPYHSINPAIRSRTHLLEVKPLSEDDLVLTLKNALIHPDGIKDLTISDEALHYIAQISNGDVRFALNQLEICSLANNNINLTNIKEIINKPNTFIDKNDEGHYNILSAFQKSIRGSDVNAALYYLALLINSNDLESIERRLLIIAYEDIGLANPACVNRVKTALDTAKIVGFPEAMIPLSFAIIDLALSPKSKSSCEAIYKAMECANSRVENVPYYLKYTPVNLSDNEKYDYEASQLWPYIQYLPDALKDMEFYQPNFNSAYEKALGNNYLRLKKITRKHPKDLK